MKNRNHIEENHRDIPEDVLQVLYSRCETSELQTILNKFDRCKVSAPYTLSCKRLVENELTKRGIVREQQ